MRVCSVLQLMPRDAILEVSPLLALFLPCLPSSSVSAPLSPPQARRDMAVSSVSSLSGTPSRAAVVDRNPLDSFFPFDPYLLKQSSRYVPVDVHLCVCVSVREESRVTAPRCVCLRGIQKDIACCFWLCFFSKQHVCAFVCMMPHPPHPFRFVCEHYRAWCAAPDDSEYDSGSTSAAAFPTPSDAGPPDDEVPSPLLLYFLLSYASVPPLPSVLLP